MVSRLKNLLAASRMDLILKANTTTKTSQNQSRALAPRLASSFVHRQDYPTRTTAQVTARNFSCNPRHLDDVDEEVGKDTKGKKIVKESPSIVKITHSKVGGLGSHDVTETQYYVHTKTESADLVDKLLSRTADMMDPSAANVVAFSGGVDSSLVAALVYRTFSTYNISDNGMDKMQNENNFSLGTAKAVLGISPAVPQTQIQMAREVADVIGIPLMEVTTDEGSDEAYVRNDGHACYVCKTHLYSTLESVANHIIEEQKEHFNSTNNQLGKRPPLILYNGTNADDTQDPTRLGLIAASNFHVASPLDQITKDEVRQAARYLGLPNWNAAASPCLRSRLAMGVSATEAHLKAVEKAEEFVRKKLKLDETRNVRVRMLAGGKAMVELDADVVNSCEDSAFDDDGNNWVENALLRDGFERRCVEEWGFKSFGGVRSFKTGSVAGLPTKTIWTLKN